MEADIREVLLLTDSWDVTADLFDRETHKNRLSHTNLEPVKMKDCIAGVSVFHSNQVVQRSDSTIAPIACNFTLFTMVLLGNGYICI